MLRCKSYLFKSTHENEKNGPYQRETKGKDV